MKLIDLILNESPLPDSWDKNYIQKSSLSDILNYLKDKAKELGSGYFRVAYIHDNTVIKFAKEESFAIMANKTEIEILTNKEMIDTGLIIPIIDYDKSKYKWVQTPLAEHISAKEYEDICINMDVLNTLYYYDTLDFKDDLIDLLDSINFYGSKTKKITSSDSNLLKKLSEKLTNINEDYDIEMIKIEVKQLVEKILKKSYPFLYKLCVAIPVFLRHKVEMDFHQHNIGKYKGQYVIFDISAIVSNLNTHDFYILGGGKSK